MRPNRRISNERATAVALSVPDSAIASAATCQIAWLLAAHDPARAEELIGSIKDETDRDKARQDVAVAFTRTDPAGATRVAETIGNEGERWEVFARIARAIAEGSPDRAVQITGTIGKESARSASLADVGAVVARTSPESASAIFASAEEIINGMADKKTGEKADKAAALSSAAIAVASADPGMSKRLSDEAGEVVRSMKDSDADALILTGVALAITDLDRGEKLVTEGRRVAEPKWYLNPEKILSDAIQIAAEFNAERAILMALRLLSGAARVSTVKEIAIGQAADHPDIAERVAGNLEGPVEQAATLIEIALIQAGAPAVPVPRVDTEVPQYESRIQMLRRMTAELRQDCGYFPNASGRPRI